MKQATVALVVRRQGNQTSLLGAFSDEEEISIVENLFRDGSTQLEVEGDDLILKINEFRKLRELEDEAFGDTVENLIAQPFLQDTIRRYGIQWFESKMRIQEYKKNEAKAAGIIAKYAYQLFQADPNLLDFSLAGVVAEVRIRIFVLGNDKGEKKSPAQSQAA